MIINNNYDYNDFNDIVYLLLFIINMIINRKFKKNYN